MPKRLLIWDLPTRVFHWLLVLAFCGAYLSGESERWALLHVACGFTVLLLMVFRLLWGVLGSRYARFAEFIRQPAVVVAYIRALLKAKPIHYVGHNPAGGMAILLLLFTGLVCALSGWLMYADLGGDWLEELHEITSALMLAVVIVHVVAVLLSCYLHQENLLRAMLDGKKSADSKQAITNQHLGIALCLLLAVALVWLLCYADTLHLTAYIAEAGRLLGLNGG